MEIFIFHMFNYVFCEVILIAIGNNARVLHDSKTSRRFHQMDSIGVIYDGTLYIANVGDSCCFRKNCEEATGEVIVIHLSLEHDVTIESIRHEILHPYEPQMFF